jgi:hypothetical protein
LQGRVSQRLLKAEPERSVADGSMLGALRRPRSVLRRLAHLFEQESHTDGALEWPELRGDQWTWIKRFRYVARFARYALKYYVGFLEASEVLGVGDWDTCGQLAWDRYQAACTNAANWSNNGLPPGVGWDRGYRYTDKNTGISRAVPDVAQWSENYWFHSPGTTDQWAELGTACSALILPLKPHRNLRATYGVYLVRVTMANALTSDPDPMPPGSTTGSVFRRNKEEPPESLVGTFNLGSIRICYGLSDGTSRSVLRDMLSGNDSVMTMGSVPIGNFPVVFESAVPTSLAARTDAQYFYLGFRPDPLCPAAKPFAANPAPGPQPPNFAYFYFDFGAPLACATVSRIDFLGRSGTVIATWP